MVTPSRLYCLAGLLCLPASLVPSSIGVGPGHIESVRLFPFLFYVLPLSAASWALGFSYSQRGTRGALETVTATIWLFTAVSMSLPMGAWAASVTALATAQAIAVGLSAVALAVSSLRTLRRPDVVGTLPVFRALHAGGGLLIALLFAYEILGAYVGLAATQSTGLARLVAEGEIFASVLAAAAAAIATGAICHVLRARAAAQRSG